MFLKQYSYKPRSNSQSSQTSQPSGTDNAARSGSPPAAKETAATSTQSTTGAGSVSAAISGRRRSSDAGKFSGLSGHKRNSQDEGAAARKASFAEQKPGQGGILSGMWNSFTTGTK